jgi:hypothetical protein
MLNIFAGNEAGTENLPAASAKLFLLLRACGEGAYVHVLCVWEVYIEEASSLSQCHFVG